MFECFMIRLVDMLKNVRFMDMVQPSLISNDHVGKDEIEILQIELEDS